MVVGRISSRHVCTECGTTYSTADESGATGVCAKCGGAVVPSATTPTPRRPSRKRLVTYNEQTAPLLAWFEEHGLLATVDGVGSPAAIGDAVAAVVDARLA